MKKVYPLVFCIIWSVAISAQSTWMQVYHIMQNNCTSSCHNNGNPCNLILTGDSSTVYNLLVNQPPVNAAALAAGNKLVDPGNPRNSFLFIKINQGLDQMLSMQSGEGIAMPDSNISLSKTQRELFRQWIDFAAQDTGSQYVDSLLIDNFYNNPTDTAEHPVQPLTPPDPSEGYQLHFGPVFMASGIEYEFNNKYFLQNASTIDVYRMWVHENPETHHFAIYDFFPGADTLVPKGLNRVIGLSDEAILYYNALVVAQWPKPMDVTYPTGTSLVWHDSTILCLDYHLINYETYTIAAEVYLNVYYNPHDPNIIALQTYPVRYGDDNVDLLQIPPGDSTFTWPFFYNSPDSAFYWNIVSIQAHTHKFGVGYNVWSRNANGQPDSLIYNGDYDPTYTYNTGSYVWNDPPYRQFDPIYPMWMQNGLIMQASYDNTTDSMVGFGLTTANEMFVTFILFYESEFPATSAVSDITQNGNVKLFPNPAYDVEYIKIDPGVALDQTEFVMYDELGRKVADMNTINSHMITANVSNLADGCYIYQLINGGNKISTGKIMVQH